MFGCLLRLFGGFTGFQVGQHDRSNNSGINGLSSHSLRMVQPKDETGLCQVVKGDQTSQEPSHTLDNAKGGKHDPVRQPLCIFSIVGIHRLEGHVRGVNKANQIHNQLGASEQGQKSSKEECSKTEKESFGLASLFFKLL